MTCIYVISLGLHIVLANVLWKLTILSEGTTERDLLGAHQVRSVCGAKADETSRLIVVERTRCRS